MPSRTTTSFLVGVGSLIDLGGTTFKRTRLRTVRKGNHGTDHRALKQDFKVVIGAIEKGNGGQIRISSSSKRKVMSARKKGLVG